jgi:hypothetical protein
MKKFIFMMSIAIGISMFISCNDDDSNSVNPSYMYKVRLTDAPGPYDRINVDLQSVAVIDGNGHTTMLSSNSGVYNILDLSNGADMLLATRRLYNSGVSQIKLGLGTNSSVVIDGTSFPLTLSTADEAGLTVNVNQTLSADHDNEILIDFDGNSSIVATGPSTYKIQPVIRVVDSNITGSISGDTDNTSRAIVTATSVSNVNYSTGINSSGVFKILGVPPGSYTLTVTPILPMLPSSQTNIVVQAGQNTVVNAITF